MVSNTFDINLVDPQVGPIDSQITVLIRPTDPLRILSRAVVGRLKLSCVTPPVIVHWLATLTNCLTERSLNELVTYLLYTNPLMAQIYLTVYTSLTLDTVYSTCCLVSC